MTPAELSDDLHDVAEALTNRMATHRVDLEALIEVPGVSAPGFDPAEVRRSAEAVADLMRARRLEGVRLLEVDDAHPAVYGERLDAPAGAPTVLLYAHHDVQPPGPAEAWTSPPFSPAERDGRLYARGSADDKGGVLAILAAVDAWLAARGHPPVGVKVLVEGEEEIGSTHLGAFLAEHADLLSADVVVLCDAVNLAEGTPAVTTSLRGLVDADVTVRATSHALHSGMYGGIVPDPVTGLAKLLASLTDDRGDVAIPGFCDDVRPLDAEERARLADLDVEPTRLRADAGLLEGVPFAGDPARPLLEKLWHRPCLAVIGVDAPARAGASNTLQPEASARVSVRLAPGQDPARALDRLCGHLEAAAPFGLDVEVTPGVASPGFLADAGHPSLHAARVALEAAYGAPAALAGVGGSIPFVDAITRALGDADDPAPALLTAVADPDARAHGIDESLGLVDWHRACLAHAYLLGALAERG
ncbi:MAG: M20/M25/M40 family metallo-hydrolase [Actinomycetota bacterium]